MVATFFLLRMTAFILFLIVPSLQICWENKRKTVREMRLNKRIAARLIWQLVIHSCIIFAYIISRSGGENNGFLAGVSLPTPSSRAPRVSLTPKTPFPFHFKRLPHRLLTKWLPCCHALLTIKMTTKKTHRYFRQMIKIKNFTNEDY